MRHFFKSIAVLSLGLFAASCGSKSSDPDPVQIPETAQVQDFAISFGFNGNANPSVPGVSASVTGNVTYGTDRKGRAGSAIVFDGNSSVSVPAHSAMNLGNPSTISFWVHPDQLVPTDNYHLLFSKGSHQSLTESYALYFVGLSDGGEIRTPYRAVHFVNRREQTQTCNGSTAVTPVRLRPDIDADSVNAAGRWYHLALVYNDGGASVYVNGMLMTNRRRKSPGTPSGCTAPVFANAIIANTEPLVFGRPDSGLHGFPGRLDDLRIYSRALTAAEIQQLASDR